MKEGDLILVSAEATGLGKPRVTHLITPPWKRSSEN